MVSIRPPVVALIFSAVACAALGRAADDKPVPTLDTFEYVFTKAGSFDSTVRLTLARTGEATYSYKPQDGPGSELRNVIKAWQMPAADAADLLRGLVDDGLMDVEIHEDVIHATGPYHYLHATFGNWRLHLRPKAMPEKLIRRLQPVLAKAHPEVWKVAGAKRPPLPDGTRIDSVAIGIGQDIQFMKSLSVSRTGNVSYSLVDGRVRGSLPEAPVHKDWKISEKDAAALLDALIEDGLFEKREANDGKAGSTAKLLSVTYGHWHIYGPRHLSEKALLRLMPLMGKGEAVK